MGRNVIGSSCVAAITSFTADKKNGNLFQMLKTHDSVFTDTFEVTSVPCIDLLQAATVEITPVLCAHPHCIHTLSKQADQSFEFVLTPAGPETFCLFIFPVLFSA